MRLIKMNCNNCGAQLDIDLDNLIVHCPYCGHKLMMDIDQLAWVLAEKEETKRAVNREEQQTVRAKMAYDHESKMKDKDWKKEVMTGIGIVLMLLFMLQIPSILFGSGRRNHEKNVEYLHQLELELEADIKAGDYDSAMLKANKLYCDDNWSSSETAAWDEKREAYIKIIEEKQRDQELTDPNNIFMPGPSSSFKGKKYTDIVDQLKSLGFTNITTQASLETAEIIDEIDTVEHILVGGKTEFTTTDYFSKDTPIIIYYYAK